MSFLAELKRRNVIRVGAAYGVATWLLLQITDVLSPILSLPEWAPKLMFLILAISFVPVLIFAWAFELTPEGLKREKEVNRDASITNVTARKLDFITIGLLLAAIAVVAVDRFLPQRETTTSSRNPASETTVIPAQAGIQTESSEPSKVAPPPAKSIAVLPFVNMSSDPEQEYFSDGISEEILNALAQIRDLKVAGRTSSFAFKGQNQDLRQIGETLGVANILEGSVRKSGTKVRITAQLIQVKDGFHLWSDTFDRELTDVFAIQDEIATAILEQLKATLVGEGAAAATADRTSSEAYDLYLLARQRINERGELPLQSAAALLDQAIALDPGYAPAYAQRAITALLLSGESYGSIPKDVAQAEGKLYIDRALSLEPDLAEANAAAGLYHMNRPGEGEQAVTALRKALAANPNLVDAANWLQTSLSSLGHQEEAESVLREMFERDPLYRPGLANIIFSNSTRGRTEESWALIERVSPFFPDDPMISRLKGINHLAEGHPGDALPLLQSALEQAPTDYSSRVQTGIALILMGQYEKATEIEIPIVQALALGMLDRPEEASLIATKIAASGEDVSVYFRLAVLARDYTGLIQFFETRWPDFESFETEFPPLGDEAFFSYADLAQAFSAVGDDERFGLAMARFRKHLDRAATLGFDNNYRYFLEAIYFSLAGDYESALANLGLAVDEGYLADPRMTREYVQLKPLEGDPAFEAIQARMAERVDAERAKIGLGPMSI